MPAINGNRIARLSIIVWQHWRKLFEHDVGRKFIPFVVVPRLRIQRRIFSRAHRIIPLPACKCPVGWMIRHQDARRTLRLALSLLKHGKLIGINGRVFVNSCFYMPAGEVSPVSARERSRTKTAYGSALPKPVIDLAGDSSHTWLYKRKSEGTSPRSFRYCVSGPDCGRCQKHKC